MSTSPSPWPEPTALPPPGTRMLMTPPSSSVTRIFQQLALIFTMGGQKGGQTWFFCFSNEVKPRRSNSLEQIPGWLQLKLGNYSPQDTTEKYVQLWMWPASVSIIMFCFVLFFPHLLFTLWCAFQYFLNEYKITFKTKPTPYNMKMYILYIPWTIKANSNHYSYVIQKLWKMKKRGISLVAQWLGFLPRQEWVNPWSRELGSNMSHGQRRPEHKQQKHCNKFNQNF